MAQLNHWLKYLLVGKTDSNRDVRRLIYKSSKIWEAGRKQNTKNSACKAERQRKRGKGREAIRASGREDNQKEKGNFCIFFFNGESRNAFFSFWLYAQRSANDSSLVICLPVWERRALHQCLMLFVLCACVSVSTVIDSIHYYVYHVLLSPV